jgi:hypothetical protein
MVHFVEPIDPKKLTVEQFQAEYDALLACHKEWEKYFDSQLASALNAKLEPPKLQSPQGINPRWGS